MHKSLVGMVLIVSVLLLAFALRLDGLRSNTLTVLDGDALDYHRIAENLLAGRGYVQAVEFAYGRQPGWPLLLTVVYALGGVHAEIGVWALALIGMLTVALTWRIGRNLGGERVGMLAALLVAIDPFQIVQDQTLLSESLYTLIFLAALWALIDKRGVSFGILAGLLLLIRSNGIGVLVGLLWLPRRKALIALIITGLMLLPWVLRNWSVVGTLSPFAPQTGQLLLGSYNDFTLNQPEAFGMWLYPKEIPEGAPFAALPYLEREKAWADRAWVFIRDNTASIPTMMGRRVAQFALQSAYVPRGAEQRPDYFPAILLFLFINQHFGRKFVAGATQANTIPALGGRVINPGLAHYSGILWRGTFPSTISTTVRVSQCAVLRVYGRAARKSDRQAAASGRLRMATVI